MPAPCVVEASSPSNFADSSAVTHNPSLKYSFLAPGLTETEYREYFIKFLSDLDVNRAEKLSEGAFGIALRCKKVGTGETYVLKKIKNDSIGSTRQRREARDQLKIECRLTVELSLQSPHVIQGLGWIPQHGMLLEHATLGSMRDLMSKRQRPLPIPVVFHIISSLIRGLASVHDAGYLHLDMKPANIFVHGDGRIVIGDFGLSAPMDSKRPGIAGSPRFMSRRQLKADVQLTREMDWYSTAAIMVEFLEDGCTMFANVKKDDPVWSSGNIVNTVTTLHLRNAYHTPKILHQLDGGLLLLEALRDGIMDPVSLLDCAPLNYGSHECFFNWVMGRRTPRFVVPPVTSAPGSVSPSPVHAVSSRSPNPRRVQAQKNSSPYHRATPRTPLRTSPRASLPDIFQKQEAIGSPVEGSTPPPPSHLMDVTPSNSISNISEHANVPDCLTGNTAINSSTPSSYLSVSGERSTTSMSTSSESENVGESHRQEPMENVSNINKVYVEIPKLTLTAGDVYTPSNQNEKKSPYVQIPTVAALAAEAAKYNSPRLAKPTSGDMKLLSEHGYLKSDSAMAHDNLSDPLYSGHDIRMVRMVRLPARTPATLMNRLSRVWRRLHGPTSSASQIDSACPDSHMSTLRSDERSTSFGNNRNERYQSNRPSPFSDANHEPVFPPHQRRLSLGFQRLTLGNS